MTIYKVESPIAISSHRVEVTSGTADDKVAGSILAAPGYFSLITILSAYLKTMYLRKYSMDFNADRLILKNRTIANHLSNPNSFHAVKLSKRKHLRFYR